MNREYHRWHIPRLQRDMELLVSASRRQGAGFPTRDGRFHEYEDLRMVAALGHKLEAGQLQLWCVDSIDWESFYCFWCHPADRLRRHLAYEEYILNEVLPLMQARNPHPCTISHGLEPRRLPRGEHRLSPPPAIPEARAFSGRYDSDPRCRALPRSARRLA